VSTYLNIENLSGGLGTTYETIRADRDRGSYFVQLARLVTARLKKSEEYNWTSRRRLPELYDTYRGVMVGQTHPFRNNVNTNSLFAVIEADVAKKGSALLSSPSIIFEGSPMPGGASYARKQQALYYQQDREDNGYLKDYHMLKAASMYGTAVQQKGWRYEVRQAAKFENIQSPLDGKRYRVGRNEQFTAFDGPSKRNIDLLDFFGEPGKNSISDMRWGASRWWEDFDAVEARFATGEFTETSELERLRSTGSGPSDLTNDMRQLRGVDAISGAPQRYDPYGRPVQLVDYIGWVPSGLAKDGIAFRRIVVANNAYVLLNEPFPWAHGRLDFVFFAYSPFADPHYFFAPGKLEIGLSLQRAENKFINQTLDGLDFAINPPTFVDEKLLLDPRGLQLKAGRIMKVQGDPHAGIYPFQFPLQGLQFGIEATGVLDKMLQKGTGLIDDVGMGMGGPARETARGVLARSEAQGSRIDMETQLAEIMWKVFDADASMELNRQFMTSHREAQLLGDIANFDPVTGLTNQMPAGATVQITPDDVAVRLRARAVGTSQRLSKAMQQQNALLMMNTAFQAAGAMGPAGIAQYNLLGWVRWLASIYEVGSEVNELVIKDPAQYGAQLAMMMLASQKGGPEAMLPPGAGTGALDNTGGVQSGGAPQPGAPPDQQGGIGQPSGSVGGGISQMRTMIPVGNNSTMRFINPAA
jgi:hypothetical protein